MRSGLSDGSLIVRRGRDLIRRVNGAYRRSRFSRVVYFAETVIRNSWLVRWLTAEPDPDVIVIDLRETRTAGPIVRLLDRTAPALHRMWRNSLVHRATATASQMTRTAPVQAASSLVLGFLVVRVALTWQTASRTVLAAYAIIAIFALLGLRTDWTLAELAESRAGNGVRSILAPPEPPDDERR